MTLLFCVFIPSRDVPNDDSESRRVWILDIQDALYLPIPVEVLAILPRIVHCDTWFGGTLAGPSQRSGRSKAGWSPIRASPSIDILDTSSTVQDPSCPAGYQENSTIRFSADPGSVACAGYPRFRMQAYHHSITIRFVDDLLWLKHQ